MAENKHQPKGWGEPSATPSNWGMRNASRSASPWVASAAATRESPKQDETTPTGDIAVSEDIAVGEESAHTESTTLTEEIVPVEETAPDEESLSVKEVGITKNISADNHDKEEASSKKKTSKLGIIITVAITVITVIVGLVLWLMSGTNQDSGNEQAAVKTTTHVSVSATTTKATISTMVPTTTSTTASTTTSTTTTTMNTTATTMTTTATKVGTSLNIQDFVGIWAHLSMPAERELIIHSVEDGNVVFSLTYYRLCSVEYVSAHSSDVGKVAHFWTDEISGSIEFSVDDIILTITESSVPYMEPEIQAFYRVDASMLGGYGDSIASPEVYEEPHVETVEVFAGNVWFEYISESTSPSYAIDHFEAQLVEQGDTRAVYRIKAKGQKIDGSYSMRLLYEVYDEQMNYLESGSIGSDIRSTFDVSELLVLDHNAYYVAVFLY